MIPLKQPENPTITTLQKQAHDISSSNGFWDVFQDYYDSPEVLHRDVATRLALIADEAHEALAELRSHKFDEAAAERGDYTSQLPASFGEELADIIIRTLDLAEGLNIDLEGHVVRKVEANKDRPRRHGKNF